MATERAAYSSEPPDIAGVRFTQVHHRSRPFCSTLLFVALSAAPGFAGQRAVPAVGNRTPLFEADVRPVLLRKCGACHSASGRAGLDIRTPGSLKQGGHAGAAVHAGSPDTSPLVTAIEQHRMPPAGSGDPVTKAELQIIKNWIAAGAHANGSSVGHWAYTPPVSSSPPSVLVPFVTPSNPIDRFLLSELKKQGLSFSGMAAPRARIRRLYIDLVGELPTPAETDAFASNPTPQAWGQIIDRLLSDPRYGERWARYWLDTAGYADSEGVLEEDRIRPNAWRYRDYVIKSVNTDLPYDRFLMEQIAGDELARYRTANSWSDSIGSSLTATGFLRTAVDATRDDFNTHQFVEYQYRMLHDTQTILISSTLGVTLQCARCHDHKYEPFTQRDYYGIQAILNGAIRPEGALLPSARRQVLAASVSEQKQIKDENAAADADKADAEKQLEQLRSKTLRQYFESRLAYVPVAERPALIDALATLVAKQRADQKALLAKWKGLTVPSEDQLSAAIPTFKAATDSLKQRIAAAVAKHRDIPEMRAIYDQDAAPPPSHILLRGEYLKPGDVVLPGIPAVLGRNSRYEPAKDVEPGTTGRRLALARWIVNPTNPLTARVEVNRIWAHHFGEGIVATLDNLGQSGAVPTNQKLLDWLSVQFVRGAGGAGPWSRKAIHRLICTSQAYQQSSDLNPKGAGALRDPEDRLLWRQRTIRLDAETLRDTMLQMSNDLDPIMFGEPVGEDTRPTGEVVAAGEDGKGRRSIYLLVRRSKSVSFLNAFDAPVMETNCTRRVASSTAVQALAVMNGTFTAARAARLATVIASAGNIPQQIQTAFQRVFQRAPTATELKQSQDFLQNQAKAFAAAPGAKGTEADWQKRALEDFCLALLSSNEFLYVD